MGDVRPVPGGGGAASLLGRSPEQRNRSIPSGPRAGEASGWLRFPPLWETSGLSLAAVRLRLSWGRLRSSENGHRRRGLANPKPPAGLGFPPMGDVWPVPGSGEAASLLGTSPEQRKRSMPSSTRAGDGSGWLRFPPLWETSGMSLVAVRLRLSWGRLRSSEIAA